MGTFSEANVLNKLKHYLPAQAPLKDFVHHNTLHAFQHLPFGKAIRIASKIFGYKVSLNIEEYRSLFDQERINVEILNKTICKKYGELSLDTWIEKLIYKAYDSSISQKIGLLRANWKKQYHLDLDTIVHTNLFRILNSYLDQGVAIRKFPTDGNGLLHSIRDIEKRTFISFFKTQRARDLIFTPGISISDLLKIVVGDERFYEQYLFDQQFAHPGWSGLVSVIESQPLSLFESRKITLNELIILELVLEIDNLDHVLGNRWKPISEMPEVKPLDLFEESKFTELDEVLSLWQEAFEWTYYDEVLAGITINTPNNTQLHQTSFQAFFCIDDRECSIRRNIELLDNTCQTFGTPGHFAVDAYYQPKNAKFYTKICPAPITPIHLLKEVTTTRKTEEEIHLSNSDSSLFKGWLISQTIGFWSAIKLLLNIFKPSMSPATSSSFSHMYEQSDLTVKNRSTKHVQDGLQIGYTVNEMVDRVESVLKSTGLIDSFASLVYIIGHGASSTNNTHYAGYDCGACSGRPGSANARAFCYMANHHEVRRRLGER
ncbi:putative inorganic carbon transporter subunit DabA, partial [Reichenbachiella sp.]